MYLLKPQRTQSFTKFKNFIYKIFFYIEHCRNVVFLKK